MNAAVFKNKGLISVIPGIAIALFFLLLPYIFFGGGRDFTKDALAQGDAIVFGIPTKILTAKVNLWSPYEQGGTFVMKDIGKQALYPIGLIIMNLFDTTLAYNIFILLQYTIAGYFTYLYLKNINLRIFPALIGGVTFMFCGFMVAHQGHNSMISAAAWLPAVMYPLELFFKKKKFVFLFVAAFCFAMSLVADYIAVSMYIGMVAFPYIIFRVWFEQYEPAFRAAKKIFVTGVASAIVFGGGVLLAAPYVFPIVESLQYVTRESVSYDFFASYSFSIWNLPMIFFPYYYGISNSSTLYTTPYYFGAWNLTELTGYMGISPLLFATFLWAIPGKKKRIIIFWSTVAVLGFLLVLGGNTPLYRLMYEIPVYNMFRVSARNWVEVSFAMAVLFAIALEKISTYLPEEKNILEKSGLKSVTIIAGIVVAILSTTWALSSFTQYIFSVIKQSSIQSGQKLMQIKAFWENTALASPAIYIPVIVISVSVIYFLALFKLSGKKWYVGLVLPLIIFDLFSFSQPYNGTYNFAMATKKNEINEYLKSAKFSKGERIYNTSMYDPGNLFPLSNVIYDVNVINGYGPIWLKRYKELTDFEPHGVSNKTAILLTNENKLISMLSAKYIITGDPRYIKLLNSTTGVKETLVDPKTEKILDGVKIPGWTFASPYSMDENTIILKSNGTDPSLVSFSFPATRNSSYIITFDVKGENVAWPLIIDFYAGNDFDLAEFENHVQIDDGVNFKRRKVSFITVENIPTQIDLRFFTYSQEAIQIANIRMLKAPATIYYWGGGEDGQYYHLYEERFTSSQGIKVYENMNWLPSARFI